MKLHHFSPTKIERRADSANGTVFLSGICCPYNAWSQDIGGGYFKEQFLPGAFSNLETQDILCTVQHDINRLLGRRSSGTLVINDTPTGVHVECAMPNTTHARDLVEQVARGDIRGMSFDFISTKDTWGTDDGIRCRTVEKATMYEVCFCPDPVYLQSTVELEQRSTLAAAVELVKKYDARLAESRLKYVKSMYTLAQQ